MKTFTPASIAVEPYSPGAALYDSARMYLGEPFAVLQEKNAKAFRWNPLPCSLFVEYSNTPGHIRLEMESIDDMANALRSPWFVRKVGQALDLLMRESHPTPTGEKPWVRFGFALASEPPVSQLVMPAT